MRLGSHRGVSDNCPSAYAVAWKLEGLLFRTPRHIWHGNEFRHLRHYTGHPFFLADNRPDPSIIPTLFQSKAGRVAGKSGKRRTQFSGNARWVVAPTGRATSAYGGAFVLLYVTARSSGPLVSAHLALHCTLTAAAGYTHVLYVNPNLSWRTPPAW